MLGFNEQIFGVNGQIFRTGSERLRGVGPPVVVAPPPADAQVIAGTILGVAGMDINASSIGEKVASNGEDLKGARQQVVQEAGGPTPVDCARCEAAIHMRMKARSNPRSNVNGSNPFGEEAMKTVARATEQLHAKPER